MKYIPITIWQVDDVFINIKHKALNTTFSDDPLLTPFLNNKGTKQKRLNVFLKAYHEQERSGLC